MTLTTQLEAVNEMLRAAGASPVSSLDTNANLDVSDAKSLLDSVSRELQAHGWHFNTEHDVPLTRDASNEILLAQNVVKIDLVPANLPSDTEPVQRGLKLYDTRNRRFTWEQDLKAEIVYLLDWDLLPEHVRNFIAKSAARRFAESSLGADNVSAFTRDNESKAWAAFQSAEADTADFNVLMSPDVAAATLGRVPLRFN
jgi:hypothetical protein